MISMAGFSSHEQQRKALGCAAELDPRKYPRRYQLAMARGAVICDGIEQAEQESRVLSPEQLVEEMRLLARDHCQVEAAKVLGIQRTRLRIIAKREGIEFPDGRQDRHLREDAIKAKKLKAYLAVGLIRSEAVRASGLSRRVFRRICEAYGIEFPTSRRRE